MHPTNVTCPSCGARPGYPCTDRLGYNINGYHDARINVANGPRR